MMNGTFSQAGLVLASPSQVQSRIFRSICRAFIIRISIFFIESETTPRRLKLRR